MAETLLNIKQVMLTAVVTCVFTIVAGVATYLLTNKQASLSYVLTNGPTLSTQGQHRRIFSGFVTNPGRKEVLNAAATVEFKQGAIEKVSYEKSTGLSVSEIRTPKFKSSPGQYCLITLFYDEGI